MKTKRQITQLTPEQYKALKAARRAAMQAARAKHDADHAAGKCKLKGKWTNVVTVIIS